MGNVFNIHTDVRVYKSNVLNVSVVFQEQSKKPQKSVKLSSLLDDSDDDYGEAGDGKNENKAKKTSEKGKVCKCIITVQLEYGDHFCFVRTGRQIE